MKVEGKKYTTKEEFLADWKLCSDEMASFIGMMDNKPASGAMRSLYAIDAKMIAFADKSDRSWNRLKDKRSLLDMVEKKDEKACAEWQEKAKNGEILKIM